MDFGHWSFDTDFSIEDWFGFLYRITELNTGREYIGKKQFFSERTKAVKGRKNRKHYKKESDWKTYTGSSIELNKSIDLYNKENYTFEIVSLHKTKGSLHYAEVELQILENVLREKLENGSKKYYNGHIAAVKFIPPDEHNEKTKDKISKKLIERYQNKMNHWYNQMTSEEKEMFAETYLRGKNHQTKRYKTPEEYQKWLDDNIRGENNPMFGKTPHNKDKTYDELYGEEKSNEIKNTLATKCKKEGKENSMFGNRHTLEQREKWKADERRIHVGEKNGMYGKPCYVNMTDDEIKQWKDNISKAGKGKEKSKEHKEKIGLAHKGKPKPTVECPHCKKIGAKGNMSRYHFDNCKSKT